MNDNIFSVDAWAPGINYYKHKIVSNNNLYYYSTADYTSSSSITTDINNGALLGYINDRGVNKPFFGWRPAYRFTNKNTPRVKKIQFGDGYFQTLPDGINNLLLEYSFTFEGDLHYITAILHFLSVRNGTESFCFVPPAPRGNLARFICSDWTDVQAFYNNYSVECSFKQSPT